MYGRSGIWFLLLVLALLAGLTMWADVAVQPPATKGDASQRHDPDYKLTNFHTLTTDQNGNPRYRLAAAEMVHFPDDDSTQLVRPRFTQYSATKPYTQMEGQRGLVTSDGEHVYMMGKVKVVRGATPTKGEMTVLTEYLHIIPDRDFARTDRPVTILQAPRTVVHAVGMEYDKKAGTVKLLKRVKAHYERPAKAAARPKAAAKNTVSPTKRAATPSAGAKKAGASQPRIRRAYEKPASP